MQNAFDNALNRYNILNIGLRFQRTLNLVNADITVFAFREITNPRTGQPSTLLGISGGFPSGGDPASRIGLNTFFYDQPRVDALTTITHEIGHAIGFRHTDFMNRVFSCGQEPNNPDEGQGNEGSIHIPGTPTVPVANSWMLACSNNTDRPFTNEDITALTVLYPGRVIPAGTLPTYRYYSQTDKDHYYTTNWYNLRGGKDGFVYENVEFYMYPNQVLGTVPLYQYYSLSDRDHYYTTVSGNYTNFRSEGIAGYVYNRFVPLANIAPVYQYYSLGDRNHFYTITAGNYNNFVSEGVAFYALR